MKKCFLYLVFISLFMCGAFLGFSQDISAFRPSAQHISEKEFDVQVTVKNTVEQLKRGGFFDVIYACQAARENDFSYCDKSKDKKECISDVKWFLELRGVAEGSCRGLKYFPSDVCNASSQGNCGNLKGNKAAVCKALSKRDASLLYKAGKGVLGFDDLAEAEESLNIYYGFKHYSELACDRFTSPLKGGSYQKKMECKVLFGSEDSQTLIDGIALDLAYLQYVKEVKNDISVCDKIKDRLIRKGCKSSRIKNLGVFFNSQQ